MDKPILKNEIEAKITGISKVEDNIIEAKNYALELKNYYSKLVFTDDQLYEAKNERAGINKVIKKISNYRKNIVSEFKKPIEVFESTAKETERILKETADFVDVQVKNFEYREKEEKKQTIQNIYKKLVEELDGIITLEKVFNEKWLNKTVSIQTVEEELKAKLDEIRDGLKAIEELHSEFELELKNTYLQDFNLSNAIFKNNELLERKTALQKSDEVKEVIVKEKVETMLSEEVKKDVTDPVMTYTLKIIAPLSKQRALKEFLELNKMDYEKVV